MTILGRAARAAQGYIARCIVPCRARLAPSSQQAMRKVPPTPAHGLLLILLIAGWLGVSYTAEGTLKPNVLLIISDDLSVRLGCYGFPVSTPNIDRLAAMGRQFGNAYCPYPLCNPSRASFMSGWRADRTGVWKNTQNERVPGATWLQEWFKARGHRTGRFGKVFHHPQYFTNWTYQFDSKDAAFSCTESGSIPSNGLSADWTWCAQTISDAQTRDGKNARQAASWIESNRSSSWLCCVGLIRPHTPMDAPSTYYSLYDAATVPISSDPTDDLLDVPAEAYADNPPRVMSEADTRLAVRAYFASTSFADAQIGVLLAKLDQWNLWNRTIVVVLGDHGFLLGEHAGIWGKRVLFDWATRVPFIVVAPGQPAPGVITGSYAQLVSLFPTLTDMCGLPTPTGSDGLSLRPIINDPMATVTTGAMTFLQVRPNGLSESNVSNAMRFTQWSLGGLELYDLIADPRENVNLVP